MSLPIESLSIGDLSRRTQSSVRSIRYYEQQGLLPAMRTAAGHRRFAPDAVETTRRIRTLLEAGLPLAVVAKVLPCFTNEGANLDVCVTAYLEEHLALVEQRMSGLAEQRDMLARLQQAVGG